MVPKEPASKNGTRTKCISSAVFSRRAPLMIVLEYDESDRTCNGTVFLKNPTAVEFPTAGALNAAAIGFFLRSGGTNLGGRVCRMGGRQKNNGTRIPPCAVVLAQQQAARAPELNIDGSVPGFRYFEIPQRCIVLK